MQKVWEFTCLPDDDGAYPILFSSFKKALYAFNDQYNYAKDRGIVANVVRNSNGISASWFEGKGTLQEVERSISIRKVSVH